MAQVPALIEIRRTSTYEKWLSGLRDPQAVHRILTQIDKLARGNPGHARSVGEGVKELKIDYGPGYRVYYTYAGAVLVILLCGGDKSTQSKDISKAKMLAANLNLEEDDESEDLPL